jgi:hypothetical protein
MESPTPKTLGEEITYDSSVIDRKSHPLWKHLDAIYEHAVIKPS